LAALAADRAAKLIAELAGGEVLQGRIDAAAELPRPRELTLRLQRVNGMLGMDLSPQEVEGILNRLGFETRREKDGASLQVVVPTFRRDVEGEADLIEEVARI